MLRVDDAGERPSTFLVASTPITAHTLNASKFVAGLTGAGHRVLWYADERHREQVEACGASLLVQRAGPGPSGGPSRVRGELRRVRTLYREQVVGPSRARLEELRRLLADEHVDAVVSDTLMPSAAILAARRGVPWATFGDGPLLWCDEDTPPFGSGLRPLRGPLGRHRKRTVQRAVDEVLLGPVFGGLAPLRGAAGLPAPRSWRDAVMSGALHLQGCVPGFEYPRRRLPEHIHFVGALGPARPTGDPVPAALRRPARPRPLAFVTQGTMREDPRELVVPMAGALVDEGLDVLVGGVPEGAWNRWPDRVTAVTWVDYAAAVAEADLFVTNGGYSGVTMAIAAGVPVVQAGSTEEKADIGARVAWAGVGARLRSARRPRWWLRRVVRDVMGSARRAEASRRLADEFARHDAARIGTALLASLADAGRGIRA